MPTDALSHLQMFLVLEMEAHGLARRADMIRGGLNHRYLNVTGRWSAGGSQAVPLLSWVDHDCATAAATAASDARRRSVVVTGIGAADQNAFRPFDEGLADALLGYLPYSDAATRRLEDRRLKLMRNAEAVLAVADAVDNDAAMAASQEAASALRKHYGGGSVTSATQYLAGKDAAEILARVLDGELAWSDGQSHERLVHAVALARLPDPRKP